VEALEAGPEYLKMESTCGILSPARDNISGITPRRQTFIHDLCGPYSHFTEAGGQRLYLNKMDVYIINPEVLLVLAVLSAQFINGPRPVKNLKISIDILSCCSISMKSH
jgi:hypothetical protein